MAGSQHEILADHASRDRAFWRAPGGWDNGLEDAAWVAVLDVADSYLATLLLFELRQDAIPAYAAPVRTPNGPHSAVRIWVGASTHGRAQTSLMRLMPNLISRLGPGIVR
jgi:hypothetical protein